MEFTKRQTDSDTELMRAHRYRMEHGYDEAVARVVVSHTDDENDCLSHFHHRCGSPLPVPVTPDLTSVTCFQVPRTPTPQAGAQWPHRKDGVRHLSTRDG